MFDLSMLPAVILAAAVVHSAMAADSCFSQGQLLGLIFGSVAVSFLICSTIAIVLWLCLRKSSKIAKTEEKSAFTNPACDVEEKGCDAHKISQKDQITMIDSFKSRKKLDMGTQKSFSMEHINEVDAKVGVELKSEDIGGLGFNIKGNMTDGIFVQSVKPKGPAELCGNILADDRIKSLTICFENMVYEDAITLLSYASPYKVKLELERKMEDSTVSSDSDKDSSARLHPLFRHNTLTNCHFNTNGSTPDRSVSTEPPVLPEEVTKETADSTSEPVEAISEIADSTTKAESLNEADISKMESSDYCSDISSYRESESDGGMGSDSIKSIDEPSQHTISDRIEISDIIVDKVTSPPKKQTKIEYCKEIPSKPKKIVSRSPSPKMLKKPPSPAPVPVQKVEEPIVVLPLTPQISSIPIKKEQPKSRIPPPSPPRAPEITEARVSRIPKRTDSMKTPVLERKLPSLPRSVTQRSHSAENSEDIWSRLYQEKKGQLKKTREVGGTTPSPALSPNTNPSLSPRTPRAPSAEPPRYGTLSRERRDRLAANQQVLDRQKEELRQLGVL